jgi:PAS domain S-box-containing protein
LKSGEYLLDASPDQKLENEALRRQMAQFFDATTDAIIFLDRNYNFVFLNRRAQELVAFGEDLRGRNHWETFPDTALPGAPHRDAYKRTMEEGIATEFENFYTDPLNMWFHVNAYPSDDGIIVFFRDITEERNARESIHAKTAEVDRQAAELKTIYDTAPIGLALFDIKDYRYLRLNNRQAAFFGLSPDQIVGKTLTEMAPIEGLKELFDRVRDGGSVINYPLEGSLITDPDTYRYWTVSYVPVHDANGSVQAITAASLEITQQRQAERALVQSEKLAVVGRLASSIAHEINNPLEAVTNLLYLAQFSETVEEIKHNIDLAERELQRVATITSQTLRFHRQPTSPQAVAVTQIIESALSIFQNRITNSGVTLVEDIRSTQSVVCLEGEIRQVVSNLIGNALDAMTSGRRILTIRSHEATNWSTGQRGVAITVADVGEGMKPKTINRLFNAFFTTKGETGTGLGLWVSKEIVDRHHGTLRVRSSQNPAHQGTVFTLFLPFETLAAKAS